MDSPPNSMDSPLYDRNPSPPPELLEDSVHSQLLSEERIGDTVFSKHWLFTTLIKLIEEVDKENEGEESELAVDVDEELQNELCKLWDMSMNSEVAKFLNEYKAVEILTGIISKSKAPRVTEICVGILGNMACDTNVCKEMAENHKFIELMLMLLESRDVPTLVESTRLMYTSISNTGTQGPWIKAIQRSEEFLQHVTFIFSSSTNCDLLKNTAELVDALLDLEADLCVSWATEEFIQSLLEATDQIGSNHSAALEVYLNIFQSFSTTEPGVEALVSHSSRLGKKVIKYLNIVCEYEIVGLGGKEGPLASALSVLNILMNTQPPHFIFTLSKDEQLIRILLKILDPLYPILNHIRSTGLNDVQDTEPIDKEQGVTDDTSKPTSQGDGEGVGANLTDKGEEIVHSGPDVKDELKEKLADDNEVSIDMDQPNGLGEDELRALTVLHDCLSHFLIEYCRLAFKDPQPNNSTKDITNSSQGEENKENQPESETSADTTESESSESATVSQTSAGKSESQTSTNTSQTSTDTAADMTDVAIDNKGDNSSNICTSILTYLDDACSRSRINHLGLILKETQPGRDLFNKLQELGHIHDKDRLVRILKDVANFRIVSRAESRKVIDEGNT